MAPSGRITTGDFAKASPASHHVRSPRFSIQRFISVATPRSAPPSRQGRSRAEPLAVDLPAIVPREGIRELDLARVLVGREAPLDELLQIAGEGLARGLAGAQDDERLRLHEPRLVAPADDGALEDGGVAEEAVLDLDGGDEGASHLEEVVAAPAVEVEALRVAAEEVPAHGPVAPEGRARLVAVVPVAERRRAPAHPEGAELPGGDVVSVGADEPRLVARDDAAEGSRSDLAEAVRDVDVEHLGRADPVEDLDAEGLLPAAVELGGERLPGRDADPQAREVVPRRLRMGDHRVDHRRDRGEDGRPPRVDLLEERLGGAPLREEAGARPDGEGEHQVRAGGVAEEELRDGDRDVRLPHPEDPLGVGLDVEGEVAVVVHCRLRAPRASGREEPAREVVASGRLVLGRAPPPPRRRLPREGPRARARGDPAGGRRRPYDEGRAQVAGSRQRLRELPPRGGVDRGDLRAGVVEVVGEVLGGDERVHHREDGARLERAEPGGGELGEVGQDVEDPVLGLDPQLPQGVRRAVREALDVGVGEGLPAAADRDPPPSTLLDPRVEQVVREVEALGELRNRLDAWRRCHREARDYRTRTPEAARRLARRRSFPTRSATRPSPVGGGRTTNPSATAASASRRSRVTNSMEDSETSRAYVAAASWAASAARRECLRTRDSARSATASRRSTTKNSLLIRRKRSHNSSPMAGSSVPPRTRRKRADRTSTVVNRQIAVVASSARSDGSEADPGSEAIEAKSGEVSQNLTRPPRAPRRPLPKVARREREEASSSASRGRPGTLGPSALSRPPCGRVARRSHRRPGAGGSSSCGGASAGAGPRRPDIRRRGSR